jgi:hypothetical protein
MNTGLITAHCLCGAALRVDGRPPPVTQPPPVT